MLPLIVADVVEIGTLEALTPLAATDGLVVMGAKAIVEYVDAPAKDAVVLRGGAIGACRQ